MASGITITFGDVAENHVGNQQIGKLAEQGITCEELSELYEKLTKLGATCKLLKLEQFLDQKYINNYDNLEASILVIYNGVSLFCDADDTLQELQNLDYDKQALMGRGIGQKVKNKLARHNLCFWDVDQEPCYEKGNGRVINFKHLTNLNKIRNNLHVLINDKCKDLPAEANYYYDLRKKCGIGYHTDNERKIVVGMRFGGNFPLYYCWYHQSKRISKRINIELSHGDIYIMSEKCVGFGEGKIRRYPILKHAAGCEKYTK